MPSFQSTRWVFTINNPTQSDKDNVAELGNDQQRIKYLVVGRERGQSGTPHLQGFVVFGSACTRTRVSSWLPRAHLEPARGTTAQAADYCKKDGDFDEYGTQPTGAGTTGILDALYAWGDAYIEEHGHAPTSPEIAREHPTAYLRYPRCVRLFQARAPPPAIREGELRPWQQQLSDRLEADPSERSIMFYVDTEGNKGKSWFQQWFLTKYPEKCQVLGHGKRDDLTLQIDESKSVFFFNIGWGQMEHFQYTVLEQLKDRMVFSPKYQSRTKILRQQPHVVVFSNEPPDLSKLAADRFDITNLE